MVPHDHRPSDSIQQPTGPVLPAAAAPLVEARLRTEPPEPAGDGDQRMPSEVGSRETEGRFRAIVELAPDATVVHDRDGCITLVNRQTVALFGYARQELLGQPVELLIAERFRAAHQQHRAHYLAAPHTRPMGANLQLFGRRRDGSEFPVEVSMSALDDAGEVLVISSMRDLSELQRVQAERERVRWQAAMDSAPEFVVTCDVDLRMTYVNPAYERLRGGPADPTVPVEELSARYGLFLPDEAGLFPIEQLPLTRAVREGQPVHDIEMVLRTPHDEQRLVVWEAAPMRTSEGELLGAVAIGHDITERKRLEQEREEARAEAEQQAEQLDRIFEQMADGLVVYDAQGRLVRTNPAVRRLLGLDAAPPDYYQMSLPERWALYAVRDEQGRPVTREVGPLARALRGEALTEADACDIRMRTLDGREVVINTSAAPLRDREGRLVGAVNILRDQTERKQMERALAESEDRYRAVVETQTEMISRYLPDTTLTFVNEANCRSNGKSREELLGTKFLELLPEWERERIRTAIQSLLAHPGVLTLEHEVRLPDGSLGWQQWVNRTILNKEGHVVELQAVGRDITERKRAEEALRASEARYRDLVETQTEMICRYLPDGTLTFVNGAYCRHYGRSREELIGTKFPDLLPTAQAERARAGLAQLAQHPGVVNDEHEVVLPDGSIGWQHWVDQVIYDAGGHVVEIQAIGRDITERKRAEAALQASEARFRAAFESAATGMMLVDTTGQALQVNRPLTEMLGYSEEELLTHTFMDLTYSDDLESNLALFQRALAGEIESYQVEKRFIHRQGHLVWTHLSAGVVRDAAGQPLYFVGQVQDITERKRAEVALRASEERFRTMADTAPVLLWVAGTDGLVTFVNAPWLRFTGRSLEQELGNGWAEGIHPDDYHRCLETYLAAFQARQRFTMEYRLRRYDGEYRWIVDTGVPRFAPDGSFLGYIGSAIDISEHKQLEQEREEARAEAERQAEQLDRIFEQTADGLVVHDAQGQVVRDNAAARRILGLDAAPPDYYQLPLHQQTALYLIRDEQGRLLAPEDAPSARALRGEVLTGADAMDLQIRTLDGREIELNVSAAPLRDREGRIVGAVRVLRDQTERKRLEREREEARANELALREVTRHMEEFLATAAHDLRSPVTGVVMGADLAQRRLQRLVEAVAPPPRGDRPAGLQDDVRAALGALAHASQAAQRLSRLIVRLFDVAEARTGKLEVRLAPCDLAALMREEVVAQRLSAPDRTIHLDLPAGGAVPVVADADRIGQVLANYLTNALKYSPPDRPVVVSLEVRERQARVAVRDEGPGLPSEEQARVWELFHRAPGVAVQSGWGGSLGLGLYICKSIVELHPGGRVGVESAVGRGSTFWFSLPLATREAEKDTETAPAS